MFRRKNVLTSSGGLFKIGKLACSLLLDAIVTNTILALMYRPAPSEIAMLVAHGKKVLSALQTLANVS